MYKIMFLVGVLVLPIVLANGYGDMYGGSSVDGGYSGGGGYGGSGGGGYHDGYDTEHHAPQPYKFGYEIKDGYGGSMTRKEVSDEYGNKKGSYGYVDSYGIYRQVEYVADKNGFRATIKTNEPGTASENPASVYIHSTAPKADSYESSTGGYGSYSAQTNAPYKSASYSVPRYTMKRLSEIYPEKLSPSSSAKVIQYNSHVPIYYDSNKYVQNYGGYQRNSMYTGHSNAHYGKVSNYY